MTSSPAVQIAPRRQRSLAQRVMSSGLWSVVGRMGAMGCFITATAILSNRLGSEGLGRFALLWALATSLSAIVAGSFGTAVLRIIKRIQACHPAASVTHVLWAACCGMAVGLTVLSLSGYFVAVTWRDSLQLADLACQFAPQIIGWSVAATLTVVISDVLRATDRFFLASVLSGRNGSLVDNGLFLILLATNALTSEISLEQVVHWRLIAVSVAVFAAVAGCLWDLQTRPHVAPSVPMAADMTPTPIGTAATSTVAATRVAAIGADTMEPPLTFVAAIKCLTGMIIPLSIVEAAGLVHEHVDILLLSTRVDLKQVAVFAVVKQAVTLMNAPLLMANIVYRPFVAELYAQGDRRRLQTAFSGAASFALLTALPFLLVALLTPRLYLERFGPEMGEGALALQIAMCGAVVFLACGSCGLSLSLGGIQNLLMVIRCSTAVAYVLLMMWLAEPFGAVGMSLAFTATIIASNLLCVAAAWWKLRLLTTIPLTWRDLKQFVVTLSSALRRPVRTTSTSEPVA